MTATKIAAWETLEDVKRPETWVERDYPSGYLRYTFYPVGKTLLQSPFYRNERKLDAWKKIRDTFFAQIPADVPILTSRNKRVGNLRDVIGFDGFDR